ncbi:hypothetical protein OAP56_02760 [Rickettsiaceae bacterium]|nr:hypothetical protein [Rickettsiaceae bacterium]
MELSKSEIKFIHEHNADFISLKYLDDNEILKQIDVSTKNLQESNLICGSDIVSLKAIKDKYFFDPFRSHPTVTFFCEKVMNSENARQALIKRIEGHNKKHKNSKIEAKINFEIDNASNNNSDDNSFASDPVDKYSNLRSEIVNILQNINIKTTNHFHGKSYSECIIGITGNDIADLADNIVITKFIIANVADSYALSAKTFCETIMH